MIHVSEKFDKYHGNLIGLPDEADEGDAVNISGSANISGVKYREINVSGSINININGDIVNIEYAVCAIVKGENS